ncbi:hypothetical protein [Paraburkholderia sp. BL27I4N3]|uniref:hypothetical protein n=1 Tax=Paraburkholderia sp. BL27I4N3 TaxID=1938805 RepID=UPI0015F2A06B|nr:hypothetical protein [Paraburkholderia sp. BL27I4N3]
MNITGARRHRIHGAGVELPGCGCFSQCAVFGGTEMLRNFRATRRVDQAHTV